MVLGRGQAAVKMMMVVVVVVTTDVQFKRVCEVREVHTAVDTGHSVDQWRWCDVVQGRYSGVARGEGGVGLWTVVLDVGLESVRITVGLQAERTLVLLIPC